MAHADTPFPHDAAIRNAAYLVRHYRHGRGELRAQAIRSLGLTVRAAFNASDDFEPLLAAILDLKPHDERPF